MKRTISIMLALTLAVSLLACANASRSQKGLGIGAAIGGISGAILGQVIGGDTKATLLGAGIGTAIGGLAGSQIGSYMDRQEQELRSAMAASEAASIRRTQDVLTATFKSDVFFDFDSAKLKAGAYPELERVAGILIKYPHTTIRIEGHTDATGAEIYNQQLSERRAEAVKEVLAQKGVASSRIQTVGFGELQPVSSSNAMNRRVNIVIMPI